MKVFHLQTNAFLKRYDKKCFSSVIFPYRNFWTLDSRVGRWTLDDGLWTMDPGLWMLDSRRWTLDAGLWALDSRR